MKKHVVIIGANFAGLSAASQLAAKSCAGKNEYQVSVIDSNPDFEWTPNIHEILSGIKNRKALSLSRPAILSRLNQKFIEDEVCAIDINNKSIELKSHDPVRFDACLIATGQVMNTRGIDSLEHKAFGFKTGNEVNRLRAEIEARTGRGKPLRLTLVGGGFSGVEALGELVRHYRHDKGLQITMVEPSARLLNGLPDVVSRDVVDLASKESVSFSFGSRVTALSANTLTLENGKEIHSDIVVWTAGNRLPDFLCHEFATPGATGINVNPFLQVAEHPDVFVAGDAAGFSPPLRKQAYHAMDMGVAAGRNIARHLAGQPMRAFVPQEKPIALAFGDMNTYLIQGETVFASPVLAAAKEAVYQLYMSQLSASLPITEIGLGMADRLTGSVRHLLLPEMAKLKLLATVRKSRVLQWGERKDMESMVKAMISSIMPA
ncbi:MAG: NADH-quinone oxidoreductase subunit F [Proteobacteria bacterium]|nr:MAG: NADH-quinone oxidoreductase subunit F [Pseudomonadota bacterium]